MFAFPKKPAPRTEWYARQSKLPEAARMALAAAREKQEADAMASLAASLRNQRITQRHRQAFEAALASELIRVGGAWIAGYRVPDHQIAGLPEFGIGTEKYTAMWDATAAGCWPICLALGYCLYIDGGAKSRQWRPWPGVWEVLRPDGRREFGKFSDALAHACEHVEKAG